ncbi:MAG TPA: efflux RND transporter periplasmic adaptor subunit [Lentimicrobium sp.]|nr:efflux RND transporter periplasmic adaptor subunit [Lentimicrobium sp.]
MTYKIFLFLLLGFLYSGCSQNHSEENNTDGHAHEGHEEPKIVLTAYSTDLELFAEADPLVIGKESGILSHFTILDNFKPLDSAVITLKLFSGNDEVQSTTDKHIQKGIYNFKLTPKAAGKSRLVYEVNFRTKTSKFEIPVEVYKTEEEADSAAEASEIHNPNAVSFTKEKSWKIDFATQPVVKEDFGQVIRTTGQVMPAQADKVIVTAKTSGIIDIKNNNLLSGKNVVAGESILYITGSGMAQNNSSVEYIEAKSNYENAKTVYERQKELAKDKIVSEKELLNSKRDYETYKVIFDNLSQNFTSSGQTIKSPINGFISEIYKKNGEYIEAGEPVFSVIKNKDLIIQAEVQSRYSHFLKDLFSATIKSADNSFALEELDGKIVSVGQNLTNNNFAIPVTLQIENKGQFMPGEFVQLFLKSKSTNKQLTVPNSALLEEQGVYYVLVQITPELFEKKEVKTGATDGIHTEITEGLIENDRIVAKGAMLVKLSQSSGALDPHAGHVH